MLTAAEAWKGVYMWERVKVFGMTWSVIEPETFDTRGGHSSTTWSRLYVYNNIEDNELRIEWFKLNTRVNKSSFFLSLLGFYAAFKIISVIHVSRRQFTYSWSLGKQTSTRLENVPCPRALHHDRGAATGDRTRRHEYDFNIGTYH